MNTNEYLDAAREFARAGGRLSLDWFRRHNLEVERKADESPVTVADREVETSLREAILRRFPDHTVVGEEYGGSLGSAEYEWIVDPIDGTKSFIRGVPLYTTLVALVVRGIPQVGVIYCPPTGEMAAAAVGLGAWDEYGRRLHVSNTRSLRDAWFLTTDPADLLKRHPHWGAAVMRSAAAVRTWADAYGYLLVARGDADAIADPIMSPWDIAPLGVIVREAGGVFTDIHGAELAIGTSAIASASRELHTELLQQGID
ncbi:MAG: inositol monophosphatase family protein [Alkalispirochaeta sp.]